jgi:hypothetical protein
MVPRFSRPPVSMIDMENALGTELQPGGWCVDLGARRGHPGGGATRQPGAAARPDSSRGPAWPARLAGRRDWRLWHAARAGPGSRWLRGRLRASSHRLDRPQRHLSLRRQRDDRTVRCAPGQRGWPVTRSPGPGSAHRLQLRGLHGRGGWLRCPGGHLGGDVDRPRLPASPSSATPRQSPSAPWARRSSPWPPSPAFPWATCRPWSAASCRSSR